MLDNYEITDLLRPEEIIVTEPNLSLLEGRLSAIHERAKFYNEYSLTKPDFLEMIEGLLLLTAAMRRSSRG